MLCENCGFNNSLPRKNFYYVIQNCPPFGERTVYGMCKNFEDAKFIAAEFFKQEFVKLGRGCDDNTEYYFCPKNNYIEILEVKDLSKKFMCVKCYKES